MKTVFFSLVVLLAFAPLYALANHQSERVYLSKLVKEMDYLMEPIESYCAASSVHSDTGNPCIPHKYLVLLNLLRSVRSGIVEHIEADFSPIRQFRPLADDILIRECRNLVIGTDSGSESERVMLANLISELDKLAIDSRAETVAGRYIFKYQTLRTELLAIRSAVAKCIEIDLDLPRAVLPLTTERTSAYRTVE